MGNRLEADVLVVGGNTAGLYFAGLMAKQGYKVIVCDRLTLETLGARFDVIHIARRHFAEFGLPEPGPGDDDYVRSFSRSVQLSALSNHPKNSYCETLVLRRIPLLKRLFKWAEECGVQFMMETEFKNSLFDKKGNICGAVFEKRADNGGVDSKAEFTVSARLVADASGINAIVRTQLPENYGMETFVTGPDDQFYVILRYVSLEDPERDKVELTTTWTHFKVWKAPQVSGEGAIFGIGANLSFDYADLIYRRFEEKGYLPEHRVDSKEFSSTPYRRPPYSLVANGFIALGDAACITNPWTGEGVPYGWLACKIAAEVYGEKMKDGGYPLAEDVWEINSLYAKAQGAEFAKNLAMLGKATDCSETENDYEYQMGLIYEDHNQEGESLETGNMIVKLLKGVLTGNISFKTLRNLIQAITIGEKMYKHYLNFPKTPKGFEAWTRQSEKLWQKAGSMAELAKSELEEERRRNI